jgi:uncharacterized SAM-binding protein YcdF (DUF218 family)
MGYEVPTGLENIESTPRLIRRWRWRRVFWGLVVVGIVAVILSGTTTWIRDGLMGPLVLPDTPTKADVIIVLGAGLRPGNDPVPPQAKQRTLEGIQLWNEHFADHVILSGGFNTRTKKVESIEMAAFAEANGLPSGAIVTEERSRDTYENAKYSLEIMATQGWKTALVVTTPYHTYRACRLFGKQGASVHCIAAPFSLYPVNSFYERLMDTRSVVREYGAIVYNLLKGNL